SGQENPVDLLLVESGSFERIGDWRKDREHMIHLRSGRKKEIRVEERRQDFFESRERERERRQDVRLDVGATVLGWARNGNGDSRESDQKIRLAYRTSRRERFAIDLHEPFLHQLCRAQELGKDEIAL